MFSFVIPKKKSNSIYSVVRPLYLYCRTIGFLQFSANITEIPDRQIILKKMDWFTFGFQLTSVIILTILSMTLADFSFPNQFSLMSFGSRTLMRCGMTSHCVFVIFALLNRRRIWSIFQNVDEFDGEIKSAGTTINYSKHKMYTRIFVQTQLVIWLLFIAFTAYSCRNFIGIMFVLGFFVSYVIVNAGFSAMLGIFTFLLLNVKFRFKKLNENLCLISPKNGKIKIINTAKDDTVLHIMRLSQLHDKLNDILETINNCYSLQVMVYVAGSFVFTVVSLYSLYKAWNWANTDSFAVQMAELHTVWSIYYNLNVIGLLWAGSTMRNEGQRTGVLLHSYINNCNNPDVVDRLMLFSQQLKHRIPEASCKLFAFDWTLLFSIVGATASYLTILIQFDSTSLMTFQRNDTTFVNVSLVTLE